jgi:hypothetical protein
VRHGVYLAADRAAGRQPCHCVARNNGVHGLCPQINDLQFGELDPGLDGAVGTADGGFVATASVLAQLIFILHYRVWHL